MFGKTKLAPKLSPGKTLAGAVGGVATSAIVSALFLAIAPTFLISDPPAIGAIGLVLAAVYGVILAVTGMVGDLAESLLKRDLDCKDSGHLPGLGGILDVLDSLIFAAPIGYLCWVLGLVGP
jgi:phosphatidate cytidylyltransferase